tara:strand:+ start:436 stop:1476 length:1041 start_codon:yes stop_codon:yes gene_type:complete
MLSLFNTFTRPIKIIQISSFILFQCLIISCDYNINQNQELIPEAIDSSIVAQNGLLMVSGNKIVNKNNNPVSFAGNSFFWSNDNWGGEKFYNSSTVRWLKTNWGSNIVRAAMGVEDAGGYLDNKQANKVRLKIIVEAAIEEGIYVIIDWHSHNAEDHLDEAKLFFKEIAETYGQFENVIYEIYNEPLDVSWSEVVKPYAIQVIQVIREIDPDNLIIVGSPEWSQRVDLVAEDPITTFSNIAYSLHFYTLYHQDWLRERATDAINNGIPIFVTEWGSKGYNMTDLEANKWMNWCYLNKISHVNWAVNDKEEEWSIVIPGASPTGQWQESDLTDAGKLAKNIISNWSN